MSDEAGGDRGRAGIAWWVWVVAALLLVYLAPFVLVLLDEVVLKTRYLAAREPPEGLKRAFHIVYAPLIWLVELVR